MLALPKSHRLASAKQGSLKEFAQGDFVLFKRSEAPALVDQMTQLCGKAGFSPNIVSSPPMMQTVLMAVASGVGVSLIPGCVRSFHQPGVAFLRVLPTSPAIDLILARHKGETSPTVSAWMDLIQKHLPKIRAQTEKGKLHF